eukprot:TRINITY_DN4315_c0_g1_i3.p4 TRINITY_DN4315_c0_g1~~TRINITY_DN4315_c0_g1_i3.p4  ORF type:complete len:120 (-),score=16.37 TRINITY_DN4315_c0_g1_i3:885-1244(-)
MDLTSESVYESNVVFCVNGNSRAVVNTWPRSSSCGVPSRAASGKRSLSSSLKEKKRQVWGEPTAMRAPPQKGDKPGLCPRVGHRNSHDQVKAVFKEGAPQRRQPDLHSSETSRSPPAVA